MSTTRRLQSFPFFAILLLSLRCASFPQQAVAQNGPQIGAQVWISPDDSPQQIDQWFALLEQEHMQVARLFLMWPYLEPKPGQWNFAQYDQAFAAAQKHHIRIVATLTPSGQPHARGGNDSQGGGLADLQPSNTALTSYLSKVIGHYRTAPALDTWLLMNEPGQQPTVRPDAVASFRLWLRDNYRTIDALNRVWGTDYVSFETVEPPATSTTWAFASRTDWYGFWQGFQTQQLHELANRVLALDPSHPLHLNPHALVGNLAELSDDLPTWRPFLDSLGCSIHPSWHFGILQPEQYAMGVSFVNDLVRGAIEPKPYWVTELQGGDNIYSGRHPMEPTPEEVSQWMWTSLASGAHRVIFWLLNARGQGVEAAEWSMLTYGGQPSLRLKAASEVGAILEQHQEFFTSAKPVEPPVTILLSSPTMTLEATEVEAKSDLTIAGRSPNAHTLEALGFYQASAELGIPAKIKFLDDTGWDTGAKGQLLIVPDARVLTNTDIDRLTAFADLGNRVIVSGLSGFYSLQGKALALADFPISRLVGGRLSEEHTLPLKQTSLRVEGLFLPEHYLQGAIDLHGARVIERSKGEMTASRFERKNQGSVLWIPSLIGIGAMQYGSTPLAELLAKEMSPTATKFTSPQPGCLLRAMRTGSKLLTVVTNGTEEPLTCVLQQNGTSTLVTGPAPLIAGDNASFQLGPHATAVTLWDHALTYK